TLCTRLGHQALPLRCLLPPSLAPPSPARVGVGRGGLHRAMPHAPITRDYAPPGGKLVTAVWGSCRSGDARATADRIEMRSPWRSSGSHSGSHPRAFIEA